MTHPFAVFGGKLSDGLMIARTFLEHEAEAIAQRVIEHKNDWTDRGMMWTLGTSAYIDTPEDYLANTPKGNSILSEFFSDAIMPVIKDIGTLAMKSAGPMENPDGHGEAALPGFHICSPRTNGRSGVFHIDLPYSRIYWPGPFQNPFSFTTLLRTPEVGSGLWHWDDMDFEEGRRIILETRNDSRTALEVPEEGRSLLTYEVGKTYIHSGRVPHAIADMGDMKEGEYRVTLQGHGAYLPEQDYLGLYF